MTGFIDYEAAWEEASDIWKQDKILSPVLMEEIKKRNTIPPGTPLTPRQAWLALARGVKMVDPENEKRWFILLGNGEVEYRDGRLLYMLGWMFNVLNSGQAAIVEEPVVVNERDTKLVVDHETANGETQNPDEKSVNYRELYTRFLSWLRDHGHDTATEVGLKIASWEEIPSDTEATEPYKIPKDQLDAFMEGLQKGSDKLYGEKPSAPIETPKCETQVLDPRCDACAWGSGRETDCHLNNFGGSYTGAYWCSRFLPADRSQVRCNTCWKSKKVSWGSDRICKQEPLSKLLPSLIVDHEDYCGHWAVTPPAWR
jgi:hypothetical protein